MTDEREIDEHLVAVLNQVLDAVYQANQAAWSATTSPLWRLAALVEDVRARARGVSGRRRRVDAARTCRPDRGPRPIVRTAADPGALLLEFLQSSYEAAAMTAEWDRASLERPNGETRG